MPEQAVAGVFHQVQHLLETVGLAEVRVGHHRAVMAQAELGEAPQLALVLGRAGGLDQRQVVPVHGQDQVMAGKVGVLDLSRPQVRQVIAAPGSVGLRPGVRRLARVVVVGAGRIHPHLVRQTVVDDLLAEHAVGGGAATDVAHADKEDGVACHGG